MPSDDPKTLDFPSSCATYRQPIFFKSSHLVNPIRTISYKICWVMTVESKRKQGFAQGMMSLLHPLLAVSDAKNAQHLENVNHDWEEGKDAALTFLYSVVGNFYRKCGPPAPRVEEEQEPEEGWGLCPSTISTWHVKSFPLLQISRPNPTTSAVRQLSLSDLPSLAKADCAAIFSSLSKNPTDFPTFMVEPTYKLYEHMIKASQFRFEHIESPTPFSPPSCYGLESGVRGSSGWNFIVFAPYYGSSTLEILRSRGANEKLIEMAMKVAREAGLEKVTAWDCEGETVQRQWMLSARKVYGIFGSGKEAEWKSNEMYALGL